MALHVPGPDVNESPSSVLNKVHQYLYAHYSTRANGALGGGGTKADANLLQQFLSAWKQYANHKKSDNNIFTTTILQNMEERFPQSIRNMIFKFKHSGGVKFEKELTNFIYGVLEAYGDTGLSNKEFMNIVNTGSQRTDKTILDPEMLDIAAYNLAMDKANVVTNKTRQLYDRSQEDINKLRYGGSGKLSSTPSFAAVQQKSDLSTKTIEVIINADLVPNQEMNQVLKLLSKATITAKNYGTGEWINNFRRQRGLMPDAINLGDTNMYRAITSVLYSLGWSQYEANSVYYGAYSMGDADALKHFTHIRFIYELTGRGQLFNGEYSELRDAEYLIWNDYNSDKIVVRSTADLVQQLMDAIFNTDLEYGVHIRFVNLS